MRRYGWVGLAGIGLVAYVAGCGEAAREYRVGAVAELAAPASEPVPKSDEAGVAAAARAAGLPANATAAAVDPAAERKIIYQATITIVVEELDPIDTVIAREVKAAGGYIAEMNQYGSPGTVRSAQWRVRIPVAEFEAFLQRIGGLGELVRNSRTSQDVTEEFFDVEARIKTKQTEEKRLLQLLEEKTGQLDDVLKVETELSRVRGEIEQAQGRLRLLANLTLLTTVTIEARERRSFEPPAPVAPTFATRIGRTFELSLTNLRRFLEGVVLFLVGLAPWLPLILLGMAVVGIMGRSIRRRRRWRREIGSDRAIT
jgi:hypothetical protein